MADRVEGVGFRRAGDAKEIVDGFVLFVVGEGPVKAGLAGCGWVMEAMMEGDGGELVAAKGGEAEAELAPKVGKLIGVCDGVLGSLHLREHL